MVSAGPFESRIELLCEAALTEFRYRWQRNLQRCGNIAGRRGLLDETMSRWSSGRRLTGVSTKTRCQIGPTAEASAVEVGGITQHLLKVMSLV